MTIAMSAVVRPSRSLALLCLLMGNALGLAAVLLWTGQDSEPLRQILALVCAIAGGAIALFPLSTRKACRIDVTGIGQLRLNHTGAEAVVDRTVYASTDAEVVQLSKDSTLWSLLMVLRLRTPSGRTRILLVLPDSMDQQSFRALSVVCRWVAARRTDDDAGLAEMTSLTD